MLRQSSNEDRSGTCAIARREGEEISDEVHDYDEESDFSRDALPACRHQSTRTGSEERGISLYFALKLECGKGQPVPRRRQRPGRHGFFVLVADHFNRQGLTPNRVLLELPARVRAFPGE